MAGISIIGLDLARNTIRIRAAGADGSALLRRRISSGKLFRSPAAFFDGRSGGQKKP